MLTGDIRSSIRRLSISSSLSAFSGRSREAKATFVARLLGLPWDPSRQIAASIESGVGGLVSGLSGAGGSLEPHENPAEAALREVHEETGLTAHLINTHTGGLTDAVPGVPVPVWIAEQHVPAEARQPLAHIHIDHLYLAVTAACEPAEPVELRFGWFGGSDLDRLGMFAASRRGAHLLLDRIDTLVRPKHRVAASTKLGA